MCYQISKDPDFKQNLAFASVNQGRGMKRQCILFPKCELPEFYWACVVSISMLWCLPADSEMRWKMWERGKRFYAFPYHVTVSFLTYSAPVCRYFPWIRGKNGRPWMWSGLLWNIYTEYPFGNLSRFSRLRSSFCLIPWKKTGDEFEYEWGETCKKLNEIPTQEVLFQTLSLNVYRGNRGNRSIWRFFPYGYLRWAI